MSKTYMIAGRAGMLGSELTRALSELGWREYVVEHEGPDVPTWVDPFTGAREVDFAAPSYAAEVRARAPDVVINCAGIIGSHRCELLGVEQCERSNVAGAVRLAEAAVDVGATFVHFTSDGEFDPGDFHADRGVDPNATKPGAVTLYGWTKYLGRCKVEAIVPREDLLVVYPSFGFGGSGDSKSALMAVLRAAAGVDGYAPRQMVQLDPNAIKELTWQSDVGRHVAAMIERGVRGKVCSTSCQPLRYGELVDMVLSLPDALPVQVTWSPDLDYKGDLYFDQRVAASSWERVGMEPTSIAAALASEWARIRRGEPFLPHTFAELRSTLSAAAGARIEFAR